MSMTWMMIHQKVTADAENCGMAMTLGNRMMGRTRHTSNHHFVRSSGKPDDFDPDIRWDWVTSLSSKRTFPL